jgi:hypothetical protein
MTHWANDYEQGLKDGQQMTNTEISDTIHRATMVAYEIGIKEGRKLEKELFWKAIDLNHTSNDIGEYIYLDDLKDALRELNGEVLPK